MSCVVSARGLGGEYNVQMCKVNFCLVVKCIMEKIEGGRVMVCTSCGGEMYQIANPGPHFRLMWQDDWDGSIIKLS